jgi:outer membrane lipoprotein LolB
VRASFVALAGVVLLAGCATTRPVRMAGDAATVAAQQTREAALAGRDHWTLSARMYVGNGKDGGSGDLTWTQDGDHYDFTVSFPGRQVRLSGDPSGALLEGADKAGPVRGPDAESLMDKALGFRVPLEDLRAWVMAVRAKGAPADVHFGADGLPSELAQDGWTISYPEWDQSAQPRLPVKVYATRAPFIVKLARMSWKFR